MTQNAKKEERNRQFTDLSRSGAADTDRLAGVITEALLEKKGEGITILDVHKLTTLTDRFVICHATSDVQIKALANNVLEATKKKLGEPVWQEEGRNSRRWVILDYVNVVVHIFRKELREYYSLEKMWNDAEVTTVEEGGYTPT